MPALGRFVPRHGASHCAAAARPRSVFEFFSDGDDFAFVRSAIESWNRSHQHQDRRMPGCAPVPQPGQRCHAQGDPGRLRRRDRAAVSCTSSASSEDFAPSDRLPRPFFAGRASSNSSSTPAVLLAPFSRIASLRLIPPISLFCGRLSAPDSPGRPLPARHPQHERPQECAP